MLRVGLTGGISSGKTTVANLFSQLGVPIIDADQIARELTEPGLPAYSSIIEKFGQGILKSNRQLDRKKLREKIFNDVKQKKWLEDLLHPLIKEAIDRQSSTLSAFYCIVVIPLLVETNVFDLVDRILVVETNLELQIKRTMIRDDSSEVQVRKIIAKQARSEDRLAVADDIIYNNAGEEELKTQVSNLNDLYCKLAL